MEEELRQRTINRLKAGASRNLCSGFIAQMNSLNRYELYTTLLFERLERKVEVVETLYKEGLQNWNQTFYLLYFRTLGDSKNQQCYLDLARRVPYQILMRERSTPHAIEAMLLGASGLLALYDIDEHIILLNRIYEHLAVKYQIETIPPRQWDLTSIRPANHPVLRLAEVSEFFSQDDFLFDRIMECRTVEDVHKLFRTEASEYWSTHYIPGIESDESPKRIGNFKAEMIGINLVAILQFTYGSYMSKEHLRESALNLLERIPAENNRYIRNWYDASGLKARNAFESQALLQLSKEYCQEKRCENCPVGRRILKRLNNDC